MHYVDLAVSVHVATIGSFRVVDVGKHLPLELVQMELFGVGRNGTERGTEQSERDRSNSSIHGMPFVKGVQKLAIVKQCS